MTDTHTRGAYMAGYYAGYQRRPRWPDDAGRDATQRQAYRNGYDRGKFERMAYDRAHPTLPDHAQLPATVSAR